MNVLILGIGDAFTARHFGSSALIEAEEGFVLIDCPDLIHRVLRVASSLSGCQAEIASINDIILTHLHGDHCNGLESFAFARRIMRIESPDLPIPRLHTTRVVADRLWQRLAPAMEAPMGDCDQPSSLEDYFELCLLDPDQEAMVAGLVVHCRFTGHPIPTIGLKVSDGKKTLGWSGDTPFEQAHIDWLSVCDLIVHESNLGPAHTPIEALNELPAELKKKIRLIHLPDDFDPHSTSILRLEEGQVLRL